MLLEKLSSSLLSAKVDYLKYLEDCYSKYGAERMANHARAIWSSLKDAISTYLEKPVFSSTIQNLQLVLTFRRMKLSEALSLLQLLIKQNSGLLVSLIIDDEAVNPGNSSISLPCIRQNKGPAAVFVFCRFMKPKTENNSCWYAYANDKQLMY